MALSVNTKALAGLPAHLDRRQTDLLAAEHYVWSNTTLLSGGMLTPNLAHHEAIVAAVARYLADAANLYAGGDAGRVQLAIDGYTHADTRAANRADATLPSWQGQVPVAPPVIAGRALGPELFDDTTQPAFDLTVPGDHTGDFPYKPSWFDLLSPSSMLRDEIFEVSKVAASLGLLPHPVDPFTAIAVPFVGDWAGLLRAAEVFDNVSRLLGDTATEIERVDGHVPLVWTGHAADGCRAGLTHFTYGLHDGLVRLRAIAAIYRDVAVGVHNNAQIIANLIGNAIDWEVDTLMDLGSWGGALPYTTYNQIRNLVTTIKGLIAVERETESLVRNGFQFNTPTAHQLGILTDGALMPDMTQPLPQQLVQTVRTPAAYV